MAEMLAECGAPEGVFQVATGRGETGAALIDLVDFVMFTGSVATGKKVMAKAAETLTPVALELGGKDPMIVLADADLERAANAAVAYGLNNSGQVCISVERIYVEDAIHDEFVERLTEKVATLRQGPPGPLGSVDIGAIIFPPQLELIEAHVADAVERGAEIRTGGKRGEGPGRFYEPTVLTGVDHSMRCMTRGDLRADPAGDAGRRRRGGDRARQRRPLRPSGLGLDHRPRARRADRAPDRGRRLVGQRHPAQLRGDGAADGRLEVVGPRLPPRPRRDPQVHEAPVADDHPGLRASRASSTTSPTTPPSPSRSASSPRSWRRARSSPTHSG